MGSGPAALERRHMGSLARKLQRVIGIWNQHGQTGCLNNQDPEEKELNLMERKNRLPRSQLLAPEQGRSA